jgi:hypothetical protein
LKTLPSGTTQLSPLLAGQLPAGLSPIAGAAEGLAVTAAIAFQTAHPSATQAVTDVNATNSFTVTVTAQDGAYYFTYWVSETANQISAAFVAHDTTANTVVLAIENPAQKNGGLAAAQLTSTTVTGLGIVAELNGVETAYQYPTPTTTTTTTTTTTASAARPAAASSLTSPSPQVARFLTELSGRVSALIKHLTPAQVDRLFTEIGAQVGNVLGNLPLGNLPLGNLSLGRLSLNTIEHLFSEFGHW